jgi:DNA-binding transcriptional LysR family regulator
MSWSSDLGRLRSFVMVAEELHFGRAAQRLHIAQPPLSRKIRSLEAELGVALFDRDTRNVALTDAGRTLAREASRLLNQADAVERSVDAALAGRAGYLRLGFVDSAAYDLVPRLLRTFRRRWPDFEVELTHLSSDDQLEALSAGELDLGITRVPGNTTAVRAEVVAYERLYVAAPRRHRFRAMQGVSLGDLAGESLVSFDRGRSPSASAELAALFAAQGVSYAPAIEATEYSTILGIVAAGEGIAVVPAGVRSFRAPGLGYIPVVDQAARMRLVLVAAADASSPIAREHFATIAAYLASLVGAPS